MSEKAAAAQKWAEAKSALDAADQAYEAAKEAYAKAEDAEFHAWQALEALAGRVSPAVPPKAQEEVLYVTGGPNEPIRNVGRSPFDNQAHRHSLPQKPIG